MLKAVVDTSVFIAGLLKDSTCRNIITHLKNSEFIPVISPDTLDELIGVLARPKFHPVITRDIAARLIEIIKTQSLVVKPRRKIDSIKEDPDDNRFLEAALAAKADVIISVDNDLLRLKTFGNIPILRPAEFLALLKK